MGCTLDHLIVRIDRLSGVEKFIEIWNEHDNELFEEIEFKEEQGLFICDIFAEPMFSSYDGGDQVRDIIKLLAKEMPGIVLSAEYECTFSNCPDALVDTYQYEDRVLIRRSTYSEEGLGDYCPECHTDFEHSLIKRDPLEYEGGFVCPNCGKEINYSAEISESAIVLNNKKWEKIDCKLSEEAMA